jgi:glycosyltransferase involved in cell wall biosynthesis
MTVLLTSEARFERTPDGTIWGPPAYGRNLWSRYLEVFSSAAIAARVTDVIRPSTGCVKASSSDIEFRALPDYSGLTGFLRRFPALRSSLVEAVRLSEAIIVRIPSPLAYLIARAAAAENRPFAAEVVGDADLVFGPGAFRHPLRGVIRSAAAAAQRQLAYDAAAVLYVTAEALQRRYPTPGHSYAASDVALNDAAFAGIPSHDWQPTTDFVLVTIGELEQPYKGTAILLEAMKQLRRRGQPVKLRIIGHGKLLTRLQEQRDRLGLAGAVEFLGQRDVQGVRDALDSAHLFVMPSYAEGLPRALLEAMARGLPAVATDVGGIPELLPTECLVPAGDAGALSTRIAQLISDPLARRRLGEQNREHARAYHETRHAVPRREFLRTVKDTSQQRHPEVRCA